MAARHHIYRASTVWSDPHGTVRDFSYPRNYVIRMPGKPDLLSSADPSFRGDAARHNPEDLLVASLSACHMLWYLSLCAQRDILVTSYVDDAEGAMIDEGQSGGRFERVVLRPRVTIASGDVEIATRLHTDAHHRCFIANSVNFAVDCEPSVVRA